jgi:acyl-CoA hydrolase
MHSSPLQPSSQEPSIRLVMPPKYTNPDGDIFGGVIPFMTGEAAAVAAVEAQPQERHHFVTVALVTLAAIDAERRPIPIF